MFGFFKKRNKQPEFDLSPQADEFLGQACSEHNEKNQVLQSEWGFDDFEEWGFSQESGTFFLKFKDGSLVEADGQAYGSWSKSNNTWEWAWNNPHVESGTKIDSEKIKAYGNKENIEYLKQGIIPCPDNLYATYLACIGEKICEAQGVYPADAGEMIFFIGLNNLRKSQPEH